MSSSISMTSSAMGMMHRPSSSEIASKLFSQLDTKNQGYIEKSDFESAFSKITSSSSSTGSSSSTSSADELFSALDSNGDGKVTKDEMTNVLDQLSQNMLNSQSAGAQGMGNMPPPPPPANDAGFTKDELTSQLSEIGSSDSARSSLISSIVANFSTADTNGDGKVSGSEAMSYAKTLDSGSSSSSTSTDATSSTSTASSTSSSDTALMSKIMQLMQAYGLGPQEQGQQSLSSLLSTVA